MHDVFTALPLAVWVHDLDPYAVKLWEGGPIRWYGLAYIAGFLVGWLLARRVIRVGRPAFEDEALTADPTRRLTAQHAADLTVFIAFGAVIGGRLGYCAFYQPALLTQFDGSFPFWGLLKVNQGGMASHGGIAGAGLAAWLFARRTRQPLGYIIDLTAFGAPLGLFFGRMANLVNGELYGRPCSEGFPLAVKFPQELTQEALSNEQMLALTPAAELVGYDAEAWRGLWWDGGPAFGAALQKMVDTVPGRPELAAALEPALTARHPSQLYAGLSEGLLVFAVLAVVWMKPRKPWTIGAVFCLVYAMARVGNEFFRKPDGQFIGADGALPAVTRGQWLSLAVFAAGVAALVIAQRSKRPAAGGWLRERSKTKEQTDE